MCGILSSVTSLVLRKSEDGNPGCCNKHNSAFLLKSSSACMKGNILNVSSELSCKWEGLSEPLLFVLLSLSSSKMIMHSLLLV